MGVKSTAIWASKGELAQRVWFTTPADAKLIFEEDRERVWENALTRRTQDL